MGMSAFIFCDFRILKHIIVYSSHKVCSFLAEQVIYKQRDVSEFPKKYFCLVLVCFLVSKYTCASVLS